MPEAISIVFVIGPTATGKTRLGVNLARRFNGEIISLDSRQVYRGLNIGTGKDLAEYAAGPDGAAVPYHLIDVVESAEEYHLFRFLPDAGTAIRSVTAAGRLPVAVGGSPLYINALLNGYRMEGGGVNPELRLELEAKTDAELLADLERTAPDVFARTDRTQRRRIIRALEIAHSRTSPETVSEIPPLPLRPLLLGVYFPRQEVHRRIEARLDERLRQGMVEEVAELHRGGLTWERLDYLGLEYRYIARHLQGLLSRQEMRDQLLIKIRHFCRSQDIWFRKMEREGKVIHWLRHGNPREAGDLVERFLHHQPLPPPVLQLSTTYYGPRSN